MKTAKDLQSTKCFTIGRNDNLAVAQNLMKREHVRHLVVTEDEEIAGILSEKDVLRAAMSSVMASGQKAQLAFLESVLVKEIMSKKIFSVEPNTELSECAQLLVNHQISCLPVVSSGGLVGILTSTDLLNGICHQDNSG